MVGHKRFWRGVAAAAVLGACVTPAALAQGGGGHIRPPTPKKSDDPPYIWNIFVLIVIVGAVFGANMIPSKRGHQD